MIARRRRFRVGLAQATALRALLRGEVRVSPTGDRFLAGDRYLGVRLPEMPSDRARVFRRALLQRLGFDGKALPDRAGWAARSTDWPGLGIDQVKAGACRGEHRDEPASFVVVWGRREAVLLDDVDAVHGVGEERSPSGQSSQHVHQQHFDRPKAAFDLLRSRLLGFGHRVVLLFKRLAARGWRR